LGQKAMLLLLYDWKALIHFIFTTSLVWKNA